MSILVLLSGGMDSTISYYWALNQVRQMGPEAQVHALTIRYGQKHHNEVAAAHSIIMLARGQYGDLAVGNIIVSDLEGVMPKVGSLMGREPIIQYGGDDRDKVPVGIDSSFIPHRNVLFITLAAMWARNMGSHLIVTGMRGGYPDCTEDMEKALEYAFSISDPDWEMQVTSPVHMPRADSIKLAQDLPGCMEALGLSLTCFEGTTIPCGKCLPCTKRAEGFEQVGIRDPLLERIAAAYGGSYYG